MPQRKYLWILLAAILLAAVFFYRTIPQNFSTGSASSTAQTHAAQFGGVSLNLEYAMTEAERERGLGGRSTLAPDDAMLFVFPQDGYYGFWMKDTLIPLDMLWLDAQGHVVYIAANVATSSYPNVFYPSAPARYVLETAAGFSAAHSIATGTPLLLKNLPTVSQ
ncbi:MAG: DUF192 domain-containing protein [Minisyncoccia bacterium]